MGIGARLEILLGIWLYNLDMSLILFLGAAYPADATLSSHSTSPNIEAGITISGASPSIRYDRINGTLAALNCEKRQELEL